MPLMMVWADSWSRLTRKVGSSFVKRLRAFEKFAVLVLSLEELPLGDRLRDRRGRARDLLRPRERGPGRRRYSGTMLTPWSYQLPAAGRTSHLRKPCQCEQLECGNGNHTVWHSPRLMVLT